MELKDLVKASVSAFNQADVETLTAFYSENAVNHQVTDSPVQGQKTVREMFTAELSVSWNTSSKTGTGRFWSGVILKGCEAAISSTSWTAKLCSKGTKLRDYWLYAVHPIWRLVTRLLDLPQ
jgi:ketosteroid isomerase-like protein